MALGQQLFGKKGGYERPQRPTVWSSYGLFNNEEGNSSVSFSFWSELLKIGISSVKKNSDGKFLVDRESEVSIFIPPVKAKILSEEIKAFIRGERNNVGITSGQSFICITNGDVYGFSAPVISVRKFNKELTAIDGEMIYVVRSNYFYAVHDFDPEQMKGINDYETYKMVDLEILCNVLDTFFEAMSHAQAYSLIDRQSYQDNHLTTTIDQIANKLGVGTAASVVKANSSNSLNSSSTGGFSKGSIDDL